MVNQVVLVGRLEKIVKNDNNISVLILRVENNFKNNKGVYESNLISCQICEKFSNLTEEHCKKDDLVGIKGMIKTVDEKLYVCVDKLTILSSKEKDH